MISYISLLRFKFTTPLFHDIMYKVKEVDKVQREELQKLMMKYGFYSLNKEPFLYDGKKGVGLSFTFRCPFYGTLTRLFIPKNKEEAEDFLKKYCWYKKNGQNYKVQIELNDYETELPEIFFAKDTKKCTLEEMRDLEKKIQKEEPQKQKNYIQKLKRSALLILEVIEKKIEIQNKTYQNLVKLTNQYEEKLYELKKQKQEYERLPLPTMSPEKLSDEIVDYHEELMALEQNIRQMNTESELTNDINELTNFLKSLEVSESLIQNKYELIKKPIEIELLEQQIQAVELLKRKRGMFGKKENLEETLETVRKQSTLKEIVSFQTYHDNEIKRIEEKYTLIPDMDIRTIGDFFVEFDNLKVREPILDIDEKNPSYELTMKKLESDFTSRPKEEQNILILYHSMLKDIYDLDKSKEGIEKTKELIDLMKNPNNILMKIKFFKNIDISSIENCSQSIQTELDRLFKIEPDELLTDINVFFKNSEKIVDSRILKASNKRTIAPSNIISDNSLIYIAKLRKNTKVYFVPTEITYDIEQEDNLILRQNQPLILIDLQKNKINEEKSDILKVVQYKEVIKTEKNYKYVTDLIVDKKEQYKSITIESR